MLYLHYGCISLCVAVCVPSAYAGKDNYQEPLQSYKSELKRDAPDVNDPGFYSVIATSQAKRSLLISGATGDGLYAGDGPRSGNGDSTVNFASPTIYGDVRGNINIVVKPGAVRGSITSVKR